MFVERAYQSILAFVNVLKAFGISSTERTESIAFIFFFKIALMSYILVLALKMTLAYFGFRAVKNMLTDLTY